MNEIEIAFEGMVRGHDIAYAMSDCHDVFVRGTAELRMIEMQAARLPREVAVRIWNKVVDEQFSPDSRQYFSWTE